MALFNVHRFRFGYGGFINRNFGGFSLDDDLSTTQIQSKSVDHPLGKRPHPHKCFPVRKMTIKAAKDDTGGDEPNDKNAKNEEADFSIL